MNRLKSIVLSVVFCLVIFGLTLFHVVLPDEDISVSERRKKQQFPEISVSSLMNGDFMENFEKYLCDQFPFRDGLRKLKAAFHFNVMNQSDNNSVYIADGYVSELSVSIDVSSVENFCKKISSVYDKLIAGTDCKVYYSIIPDKNRFIAQQNGYPSYDYNELYAMVDEKLPSMTKIEIEPLLSADCYYYTDSHWRQDKIIPVAEKINESMGMKFNAVTGEKKYQDFYGVYHARAALNLQADELICLTNDVIEKSTAYNFEKEETTGIYNTQKLESFDAYEVFLSGSVSLIEINNPSGDKDKQLIIFRDSFGSSLAPLLLSTYSKVTVVDTRYIMPDMLSRFIDFDNQDVLFIYSTMLINNSISLK